MFKPLYLFTIVTFLVIGILPGEGLFAQRNAEEALHLHTDKDRYLAGDTVWFKCYAMQEYMPGTVSGNLYLAIFNGGRMVAGPVVVPIIDGMADGHLLLPDSGLAGVLTMVAATNASMAGGNGGITTKLLELPGMQFGKPLAGSLNEEVAFYPGGGHFVDGVENKLAVKLKYAGNNVGQNGFIINEKGSVVDSFAWGHNGMAMVKVVPDKNNPLYLGWINSAGLQQKTPLPVPETAAIALTLEELTGSLIYIVSNPNASKAMEKLRVEASFDNQIVYKAALNMSERNLLAPKIPLVDLPAGVLRIALYDSDDKLVADELSFINQQKVAARASVTIKTKSLSPRSKNEIEVSIADSQLTYLSLAVYDASLQTNMSESSIYEDLFFTNSIEERVKDAGWYFSDTTAERRQALAVLMQASTWRKPAYNTEDSIALSSYLGIRGTVTDLKGKPASRESVTVVLSSKESGKKFFQLETDALGRFSQDGLIFYDSATVSVSVENPGKRKVSVQSLLQPPFEKLAGEIAAKTVTPSYAATPLSFTDSMVYAGHKKSEAVILQNVTVLKYKSQIEKMLKLDEKYAGGPFRGGASSYAFDVLGDPLRDAKFDIYNYIESKGIPGLDVVYNGYKKEFKARRGPIVFFINESEVDKQRLENINLWDIAYVKYIEMFGGRNGFPPAIAIYLKTEADYLLNLQDIPGKMTVTRVAGYTPVKNFYSPEYTLPMPNEIADVRSTLLWQPYINLGGSVSSVTIPFYTNDFSKKLKLVLEGLTAEGRVVRVEKLVE